MTEKLSSALVRVDGGGGGGMSERLLMSLS